MKITKQQRSARDKAVQKASITAIRQFFTGAGAKARSLRFARDWLYVSAGWFAKLVCLASWAMIAGLLIGPQHAQFLTQFHAWMVATPASEVLSQSHAFCSMIAVEIVKLSLSVGLVQKLLAVVKPAVQDAKNSFNQALA